MDKILISFVVATFNRGAVVVDCLRRVRECGLPAGQFEILVVDNASTDGTPEWIRTGVPEARVMELKRNCGPVAKNVAMAEARGEFVVMLDDDAYPLPGAVMQMVRHFREDATLGAAVFDVTLPDGTREASAYPDVFIGAGTGLRRSVIEKVGMLPGDFFMQAEEYDLSFRILEAGYSVQRFWDLPLVHLKSPGARIGQRTTKLDVRNNLYLLAKYVPEPLCHELAADWLSRYWMMAVDRDGTSGQWSVVSGQKREEERQKFGTHKKNYMVGAAQGLAAWGKRREGGRHVLSAETLERVFKFEKIRKRMERAVERTGARRVLFADFGKNMLAYYRAAMGLGLEVAAIVDDRLAGDGTREYRGVPIVASADAAWGEVDLVIVSNMSPVHAPRRAAELKRVHRLPVLDLFSRQEPLLHGALEEHAQA